MIARRAQAHAEAEERMLPTLGLIDLADNLDGAEERADGHRIEKVARAPPTALRQISLGLRPTSA